MAFIKKVSRKDNVEVNASSMADIAFLLLIFFLVTTTIATDKGLAMRLPPYIPEHIDHHIKKRNVFNILVNSQDNLLVEEESAKIAQLNAQIKEFIANPSKKENLSETPEKAIVSIKTDRGTTYQVYVAVLDEVKRAYHELRATFLGISVEEYLVWANASPETLSKTQQQKLEEAKLMFPMQISEAEPSEVVK
ncbi:MAG: biopolymer transporter ExbD [Cytophagales bacterium]|nr:MAG: biopolymer transporter ExbD [Cytophagales bacterium]